MNKGNEPFETALPIEVTRRCRSASQYPRPATVIPLASSSAHDGELPEYFSASLYTALVCEAGLLDHVEPRAIQMGLGAVRSEKVTGGAQRASFSGRGRGIEVGQVQRTAERSTRRTSLSNATFS